MQAGLGPSGRSPSSRGRIALWVVLSLLTVLLLLAGSITFYIWNGLRPAAEGQPVTVEIPKGTSSFRVAELLEEKGVIRNAFLFKYYLQFKDQGERFQAGRYEMIPGAELDAIIRQLNEGRTVKAETIRFTIPEGFTVLQIADALAKLGAVDREAFLRLADSPDAEPAGEYVRDIPADALLHHRLEGYLFPETYEFKRGAKEAEIIARMQQELDRKLEQLPEGWEAQLETLGVTFHELMTIASLVEREVMVPEERALVAGVIYNRLEAKMPLQIDATVQYVLDKPKERLLEKDLEIDDPYNTYKIPGLPPGPIASPSLASIQAALYPEQSDYFYYVTKKDGSNTHLFARTFKEHQANIRKSAEPAQTAE